MKKEYIVIAGRKWKWLKQRLSDEMLEGQKSKYTENIEINLSDNLDIKKGDLIKVTLEKIGVNQSPTSQTSPKGDFSNEKEHNIVV